MAIGTFFNIMCGARKCKICCVLSFVTSVCSFWGLWHKNVSIRDMTESYCSPACGAILSGRSVPAFQLFRSFTFILCNLCFNIIKILTKQGAPYILIIQSGPKVGIQYLLQ